VDHTYDEHCRILNALFRRKRDDALLMLRAHIEQSKIEVRKISLSMLADARQRHQQPTAGTDSNDG
jgi:DNA-binding GntR family transcriptional regulator